MTSPLIRRLTDELGWPHLDDDTALEAWLARGGTHCLFVPGDPAKNLESNDAAVILPELVAVFRGRFDCAVIGDTIERPVRERFGVWPTPSLIFVSGGQNVGDIPRVRDWDDYLERTAQILSCSTATAA